jgi:regulator of RNase E activity RraA
VVGDARRGRDVRHAAAGQLVRPARPDRDLPRPAFPLSGAWRWKALRTRANGQEALAFYAWDEEAGAHLPFALNVLTFRGREISDVVAFVTRSTQPDEREAYHRWVDQPHDDLRLQSAFARFGCPSGWSERTRRSRGARALRAAGRRARRARPARAVPAAGIAPLDPSSRIAGRALTVALAPAEAVPDEPYRGLLAMLGAVRPGDVVVVATGRSDAAAVWGELTSSSCVARGPPAWSRTGSAATSSRSGRSASPSSPAAPPPWTSTAAWTSARTGLPVDVDGVAIAPGDLVVADVDGVVVVPADVAPDVLRRAGEKAGREEELRLAVLGGEPIGRRSAASASCRTSAP